MNSTPTMTAYINPRSPQQLNDVGGYTLANGKPAIDVVCIFGGNYAADTVPYLRAENNSTPTNVPLNRNILDALDAGCVEALQAKGLKVLLTVLNGFAQVGWSQFTLQEDAIKFAKYLKTDMVDKYGFDGIDIDDEYSDGPPNRTSLVMVTSLLREMMPDKLLTKALWWPEDLRYFGSTRNGKTLGSNLSLGWEMSYGDPPAGRLEPYIQVGMSKETLSLGFWDERSSGNPAQDVQWLKSNGYGGAMIFGFEEDVNVNLMGTIVNGWYGPGNWNPPG
jgi:hypothetical protein